MESKAGMVLVLALFIFHEQSNHLQPIYPAQQKQ